jgi:hypothetical protein
MKVQFLKVNIVNTHSPNGFFTIFGSNHNCPLCIFCAKKVSTYAVMKSVVISRSTVSP